MVFQTVLKHKLIAAANRVELACEAVSHYIGPV
jgi:hypothetical protein